MLAYPLAFQTRVEGIIARLLLRKTVVYAEVFIEKASNVLARAQT